MKKIILSLSLALLGFTFTANAQIRHDETVCTFNFASGQFVMAPIDGYEVPQFYSWNVESGSVSFANQRYDGAVVYGTGTYVFTYYAVYSKFTLKVTYKGTFRNSGGGTGNPDTNVPMYP